MTKSKKRSIASRLMDSRVGLFLSLLGVGVFSLFYPKWVRGWLYTLESKGNAFDDVVLQLSRSKYSLDIGDVGSTSTNRLTFLLAEKVGWLLSDLEAKEAAIQDLTENVDMLETLQEEDQGQILSLEEERCNLLSHITRFYPSTVYDRAELGEPSDWYIYLETDENGVLPFSIPEEHRGLFNNCFVSDSNLWVGMPKKEPYVELLSIASEMLPPQIGTPGTVVSYTIDVDPNEPVEVVHFDLAGSHSGDTEAPFDYIELIHDKGGMLSNAIYKFIKFDETDELENAARGYVSYTTEEAPIEPSTNNVTLLAPVEE